MVNTANSATGPMINRRIDPALDRRRLVLFFAGLIAFYVAVLLITQPVFNGGEAELNKFVIGVMLAPTVGANLGMRLRSRSDPVRHSVVVAARCG